MTPGVGSGDLGDPHAHDEPSRDDIVRRLDQLAMRVEALGGLVESLFDRVEQSVSATAPLTAEELADVAARMVRLIEARLESHTERLERSSVIDDHLSMIGRALLDVQARVAELPDRDAVRELSRSVSEITPDSEVAELRAAIDVLPSRVAMQQPAARLDAMIIERLNSKLSETAENLSDKVEELLAARVQRFEQLSQSMMTLVGDPVDSLNAKLNQVILRLEALEPSPPPSDPE